MNSPARSRGLLPYYRSQVGTTTQNKSPRSPLTNNVRFKQSLVPQLSQNNNQMERTQLVYKDHVSYPQPYTQRNTIRGYQHLLSPRSRADNIKPLSTYRSTERFSPRQYQKDSEVEMEENRSVKFIEKLREEIGGRKGGEGRCREGERGELGGKGYRESKGLVESKVNENTMRSLELCSPSRMKPRRQQIQQQQQQQQRQQPQSPQPQRQQSPLRQSFQKKLVSRCKHLQTQLQSKQTQLSTLSKQLSTLQHKHSSQVSSLRSKHQQQLCKVKSQLQISSRQLEELEKSYKAMERAKNVKEKAMAEEIAKYVRQVKEKEQERNRLGLELEQVMRDRREKGRNQLMAKESTKLIDENKVLNKQIQQLKGQISQLHIQLQSSRQQREDIFQQSKLLNLQLQNYLKWNQQISTLNRSLQQQLHQSLSQQKHLQQQLQASNIKLQQCQFQAIGEKDSVIASLRSQLNSTSQQLEIMRFQGQSLKNQMEVKQGQFKRQQARLQQELEVTEVRLMGNIREKQHLAQELQYNRKELANVRRLCDQLEGRLQEERRDGQELQIIKDRLELECKQVRNRLTLVQERNIHLQNQINQLNKHSHQIQQQLKLANHQTNLPAQQQQQPSFLVQQRLCLLQSQLRQLQAKYRQQKQHLSVQYESQFQQHKRTILQLQKQLFRKEENAIDDQRRYKVQQLKLEDRVKELEQQLMMKGRELAQVSEENNVKDVKVRHLVKKVEDLKEAYERRIAGKERELTDLKLLINVQVSRVKQYYLDRIEMMCQEIGKHIIQATNHNNSSQCNQQSVQHMITSCTSLSRSRRVSPQKHRQQLSRQANRPIFPQNRKPTLHSTLTSQQLQQQLHTRTIQITCYLSLLHKKTSLYQTTISQLQHQLGQLPLKVQQKYMSRISQLQQALKKEEGKLSQMKQRHQGQVQQQKQRHQREVQRIKNAISGKEEQIQELKQVIDDVKKLNDKLEQTVQEKEKQLKRNVKKLSAELEEYKQKYNGLLESGREPNGGVDAIDAIDAIGQQQQGQESRLYSPSPMTSRNNMSSMTTVNLNNNNNGNTKPHQNTLNKALSNPFNPNPFNPSPTSPSLQQLLQTRLNQLTLHNEHLSHQLSLTATQLHRQRQHTTELTDIIRQLQMSLQKEIQQNRLLGGEIQRLGEECRLNSEKVLKVQSNNMELQAKIKQMLNNKELSDIQISQIRSKLKAMTQLLKQKQHQINQHNKLIQHHTKTQQQTNNHKQQLTHKNQQLQTTITTLTYSHKQTQQNLSQTQTKLTMLQNLYQQLLQSFQHLPNTSPFSPKPHQPQPPHSNQQQYITSLTSSFTNKLQALHHTIQQFKQINEGLKTEILRHKSLVEQKALEVLKKETEIQQLKDKFNQMKKHVNRLQVEVEEWKFIAQSNSLNKSLSLQLHLRNSQTINNRHQLKDPFHLSTVSKPQKEKCSRSKSPLKPPPALKSPPVNTLQSPQRNPFCNPSIKNQNSPYFQQYENKDLKGSVDSMNSEIGQLHQYQNRRNHLGGSAAEMSFF